MEACAAIADKTGKRPVYAAVRIDIEGGVATFAATNGQQSIRVQLAQGIEPGSEGSVFLPSQNLLRMVKDAKKETFTVEWDGKKSMATIRYGENRLRLPIEPPENLPPIQTLNPKRPVVKLQASALTGLFRRTICAVQTDFTNRSLHGVCLRTKGDQIVMAATDGMRFSLIKNKIENPKDAKLDTLVPPPSLKHIDTLYHHADDWMEIQATHSLFLVKGPAGEMSWRTIVGDFPDYEGHIPLTNMREMVVNRKALIEVCERHGVIQTVASMKHKLTLTKDRATFFSQAGVDGEVAATMKFPWEWEDMVVHLNPQLVVDGLSSMDAEEVLVGIDNPVSPLSFKEQGGFDFRYMVVPMSER